MSDQSRTEDKDTTIKDKGQPQDLDADVVAGDDELSQEDIVGNGATDRYRNADSAKIKGEDTEKFGIKDPDAMGAGR